MTIMNYLDNCFGNTNSADYCLRFLETKISDLSFELSKLYHCGTISENKDLIEKSQELDRYIVIYLKKKQGTAKRAII